LWFSSPSETAATLFFDDFENGVSRNTSGGIWYGYDNGFFGNPQWLESDSSHNHTPAGSKSARAYEADPWVYNSYADFGATGGGLTATVYLYEDMTYTPPYTDPHELQREPYIEVRSMFTLFGDSANGPSEIDPNSDYLQIRLIPDAIRPPDPAPAYYTYGIRTKYNDDNSLGIIDTLVQRRADWLKLTIEVDSVADGGQVRFFIDDLPVGTSQRSGADLRWVMMGATGPTYENYWYDDISVASLNGDYNGDGSTDAADYVLWRSLNGNNLDGYAAWRTNFNPGAGAGNNGSLRSGSSIPEPSQKILAAVGGCLLLMIRSPRRRVSEEVCVRVCVRRIAAYRKSKNRCVLGRLVVACH
jgi:hypothetical protein